MQTANERRRPLPILVEIWLALSGIIYAIDWAFTLLRPLSLSARKTRKVGGALLKAANRRVGSLSFLRHKLLILLALRSRSGT